MPHSLLPEDDCLGHRDLAQAMLRTFDASRPPLNVLVFGPWGSGKSTFLEFLARTLEPEAKYHVVRFNPWEYESSPNLLFPLLRTIHGSLPPMVRNAREVLLIARSCLRAALDIGVRVTSSVLSAGTAAMKLKDIETAIQAEESAVDSLRDPVTECKENFRALVGRATAGDKRALLVLLDDLDRCLPETSIALIESVKLYLSASTDLPVVFVWAMDKDVVTRSLAAKYAISGVAGRDYLEKIFDYQVPVPRLTAGTTLQLWRRHSKTFAAHSLDRLFGLGAVQKIAEELDILPLRNPRTIERLWNIVTLLSANAQSILQAAETAQLAGGYRRQSFAELLLLGIILAYTEKEWRFDTLHNQDDWGLFLRHCDDSTPNAQEFIAGHLQLFRILEGKGFASISGRVSQTGVTRWQIEIDRERMEKLLAISEILARHGC